ncbi:MAG TPA: helix-turn-helix transcriptional regulator [Streptosporangiaceae bacterium]|nr:helix-turn-helix transcriptional regulator [Streptosporangiaceae bacterium]
MVLRVSDVRGIVERVCARQDVLDACGNRDLGTVIEVLGAHGVTQGQVAGLTGIPQGRLSEYKKRKRAARASSTFEAFADGLGMPPVARQALGLAPDRSAAGGLSTQLPGKLAPDVGLAYPDAPAEAAENVARLWRADLGDVPLLRARLDPGAWNNASLRWLVDPGRRPDSKMAGGARIGLADVDRFRATVELFRQLDDRFGGGHARQALVQYLSTDADRLLHGRYTEAVGRAVFSATAEATLLAAWMSYDSVPGSSLAQRYFIQALALAQAGDDRLLGASVLDAMSHQATYTGRFGEAANLARAAMTGTREIATATLTSHFHIMEARALARLGDAKGCDRALAEAIREFERRKPEDDPGWIQYFDESELSAEFGHCLRDLGRATDAVQYASRSLIAVDETTFVRSDFFTMMVLADAQADAGELEQACSIALHALTAGEQIRSARCINYLREFRQRLAAAGSSRSVAEFHEQAITSRLWRIASRSDKGVS